MPLGEKTGAFTVVVGFTEPVTGFSQDELSVTGTSGARVTAWHPRRGERNYTATITPTRSGSVVCNVAENVAQDAAGNWNTPAAQKTVTVNLRELDTERPRVRIGVPSRSQTGVFNVVVGFTEPVTGFTQDELSLADADGAEITAWRPHPGGRNYTATVTPDCLGSVVFNIAANVAHDAANNPNTAAKTQTVTVVLSESHAAPQAEVRRPDETALLPNYPNPFNPDTWIPYRLSETADVTVKIFAADGHAVRQLALGSMPAGFYETRARAAHWDGRNASGEIVSSGVYFYLFTAGDFHATRKMLVTK